MSIQGFYTNKGSALAAKIAGGLTALTVTRVVAGSGHTADIPSATSLPDTEQTLTVGTAVVEETTATLPVTLAEAQAISSYSLTELGVYATDPQEGEILMQVYQLSAPQEITVGGEGVLRFYLRQTIGAQGVTVTCSPAGLLLEGDLPLYLQEMGRHPQSIHYHVAKHGSDTTGDGSAERPFQTIQKAVDMLPKKLIGSAIIDVGSGRYEESVYITGFTGDSLRLRTPDGQTAAEVKCLHIYNCSNNGIFINHFTIYGTSGDTGNWSIFIHEVSGVCELSDLNCTEAVTTQAYGAIEVYSCPMVRLLNCVISNKQIAIDAHAALVCLQSAVSGENNVVAIRSGSGWFNCGAIVLKGNSTLSGEIQKGFGGQVW